MTIHTLHCRICGAADAYARTLLCPECSDQGMEQPSAEGFELHSLRCDCELCESVRAGREAVPAPLTAPPLADEIRGVPMDDGAQRGVLFTDRGFYRSYTAFAPSSYSRGLAVELDVAQIDCLQITAELEREAPVVGTVAFRLVDGKLVAVLTSYVAYA